MKKILTLLFVLSFGFVSGQKIHYNVSFDQPQSHYANVEMVIEGWSGDSMDIVMPSWTPGSYLIREFPKNINHVTARDSYGNFLFIEKKEKGTWQIFTKSTTTVKIYYDVYCFETSVRTSFIDEDHAFLSPTGIFMYVDGFKHLEGSVQINKPKQFKIITTGLPAVNRNGLFRFVNYDQLADCPFEIGNQDTFMFWAGGTKHTVAMYGGGNYDKERLRKDMAKICQTATDVIGENPNQEYAFIVHNLVPRSGGLEHMNSATLQVNRWTYSDEQYTGFLGLVAHEYFHLWLVKRIRPIELGPFDYAHENYSRWLWAMEGWANYYADKILYRAGFTDRTRFINSLISRINYIEGMPGSKIQSVADAGFDAWIKAYRPTENSANTTTSYYSKGAVLGALLDFKILENTRGVYSLDDFLRGLYYDVYKKTGNGYTDKQFMDILKPFAGKSESFFTDYVYATKQIPYEQFFADLGVKLLYVQHPEPYLGMTASQQNGKWMIQNLRSNGAAALGGLNVNDELLAVDGWRFSQSLLDELMKGKKQNSYLNFIVSRDEHIKTFKVLLNAARLPSYKIVDITENNKNFQKWIQR